MPTVFESYSLMNPTLLHSIFHLLIDNYLQMILLSYTIVRIKKTKQTKQNVLANDRVLLLQGCEATTERVFLPPTSLQVVLLFLYMIKDVFSF